MVIVVSTAARGDRETERDADDGPSTTGETADVHTDEHIVEPASFLGTLPAVTSQCVCPQEGR
jgi:hypothetical protein